MKYSSLAALEVVKMTTSNAASDENFVKMTTFLFQCTRSVTLMELDTVRRLYLHKFDTCSVLCFEHYNTFKHVITPYARKS